MSVGFTYVVHTYCNMHSTYSCIYYACGNILISYVCDAKRSVDNVPVILSFIDFFGWAGTLFAKMIDGKSRDDLESFRTTLIENGLVVDSIAPDQFFGHDYFQLTDPDGNGITFYTSHTDSLAA